MARLDIGGTQIEIGDDFLKLSPQDQDAFVKNTIIPSQEFQAAQKATAEPKRGWADVPLEAVKNIPSDAFNTVADILGTGASVAKTVAPYVMQHGPNALQAMAVDAGKAIYNDPALIKKIPAAVWNDLVESYGSEDAIKKTIATRP